MASPPAKEPNSPKQKEPGPIGRFLQLITAISRGIIYQEKARRNAMMWTIMTAAVMLFVGWAVIHQILMQNVWVFFIYWGICAWLTLLAILLAAFDMLIQVAKGRATRRVLKRAMLDEELMRIQREVMEESQRKGESSAKGQTSENGKSPPSSSSASSKHLEENGNRGR